MFFGCSYKTRVGEGSAFKPYNVPLRCLTVDEGQGLRLPTLCYLIFRGAGHGEWSLPAGPDHCSGKADSYTTGDRCRLSSHGTHTFSLPIPRAGRRAGCESPGLVVKHYITKALRGGHPDTPAYRAGCQQHCTQSPSPSWNWAELRTQTLRQNDTWHFSGVVRTRTQAKCQMCHQLSSFCTELRTAGHQNHSSRPDPHGYH